MKRIAILIHELAPDPDTYLLGLLMAEWRKMGHEVKVLRGIGSYEPADLLIPHLDMTVIPEDYRIFMARYPRSINTDVIDISKSKVSSNLLGRTSSYAGPVIVKTDRNFGGVPEARFRSRRRATLGERVEGWGARIGKWVTGEVPWRYVKEIKTSDYRIFPSLNEVPAGVFGNRNLVVEKFSPERVGDSYAVRYYWFCGDREISYRLVSRHPIIKVSNTFLLEEVPVPPALRAMRREMGFEFGKFDYVLRDGEVMLFDANRTPGGSFVKNVHCTPLHSLGVILCEGIDSLLHDPSTPGSFRELAAPDVALTWNGRSPHAG